jgi:uncharacterized damage-inducible protein DinB
MRMNLKKMNLGCLAFAGALALAPLAARAQSNPITNSFRRDIEGKERNLAAGAEIMPADKYGYKPTPEQMSFGQMVLHVAQSSSFVCSRLSGGKPPSFAGLTANSPKEKLIAAMRSAATFCNQVLAKVNDSELSADVPLFGGRQMPKAAALVELVDDLADHYSQESIYLRMNGHLPPTAMHGMRGMRGRGRRGGM